MTPESSRRRTRSAAAGRERPAFRPRSAKVSRPFFCSSLRILMSIASNSLVPLGIGPVYRHSWLAAGPRREENGLHAFRIAVERGGPGVLDRRSGGTDRCVGDQPDAAGWTRGGPRDRTRGGVGGQRIRGGRGVRSGGAGGALGRRSLAAVGGRGVPGVLWNPAGSDSRTEQGCRARTGSRGRVRFRISADAGESDDDSRFCGDARKLRRRRGGGCGADAGGGGVPGVDGLVDGAGVGGGGRGRGARGGGVSGARHGVRRRAGGVRGACAAAVRSLTRTSRKVRGNFGLHPSTRKAKKS